MKKSSFSFTKPCVLHLSYMANYDYSGPSLVEMPVKLNNYSKEVKAKNSKVVGLNITIGEAKENKLPFLLTMTIEAIFKWSEGTFDENVLNTLLTKNAPALLLSYARPIISNITGSGPFASYEIPFFNFTE